MSKLKNLCLETVDEKSYLEKIELYRKILMSHQAVVGSASNLVNLVSNQLSDKICDDFLKLP